ncbi:hypothetical protein [Sinomicrobium weinanense]|uniref:Uncharacterized protein n=1 Tax=Sinomicrobium weinanense TaxID=2842200 RepID=A0A926Q2L9_9FLAO|nr:hypothetical protein [Sinomicrobium weinanense]MBC9796777.1 hypothetical protein [Sinomicrobium weinanense]MBU3125536.1 hypothetical protein [Sinomicrobium weinanense]
MSKQTQVVDWALNVARQNQKFKWTNNPNYSSLTLWVARNLKENPPNPFPLPPLNENLVMICYEFPLYAAATTEAISLTDLIKIYEKAYKTSWDETLNGYWFSNPTIYNTNTHKPDIPKGNIVFFNDTEHIAMSTGDRGRSGNQMVVSFWGFSKDPGKGFPTPLTVDSVEALTEIMKPRDVKVGFAKAPW